MTQTFREIPCAHEDSTPLNQEYAQVKPPETHNVSREIGRTSETNNKNNNNPKLIIITIEEVVVVVVAVAVVVVVVVVAAVVVVVVVVIYLRNFCACPIGAPPSPTGRATGPLRI